MAESEVEHKTPEQSAGPKLRIQVRSEQDETPVEGKYDVLTLTVVVLASARR